ncbi:MAG: DUF2341 domain-containing protein [Candidatus Norongarragalinales archaeon]
MILFEAENEVRLMKKSMVILFFLWVGALLPLANAEFVFQGLVARYSFNDCTAKDTCGLAEGNIIGATCVDGGIKDSKAMQFNGVNNYIDLRKPASFPDKKRPRTLCGWGKPVSTSEGWGWIASYGSNYRGGAMFIGRRGKMLYGGGISDDITLPESWTANEWKFVCLTYDGTTARLYDNGKLAGIQDKDWNVKMEAAYIGRQVGYEEYWAGLIDEVTVYDRALSDAEIKQLYDYYVAPPEPWWNKEFKRRKQVTVKVASGSTKSGHQVLLNVKHDEGMRTDFADLRFVSGDGLTELPYWIESKADGSAANVWVKVDQKITPAGYAFYLYYGNAAAPSKSNGSATFEFFDDFNDGNYADKWTPKTGYWREVNGYLQQDDPRAEWDASKLFSKNKVDVNGGSFWMQSDEYTVSRGDCQGNVNTYLYSGDTIVYGHTLRGYGRGSLQLHYPRKKFLDAGCEIELNTWHRIRTIYDETNGVTVNVINLKNGREVFKGQKTDYAAQEGEYDLALTACTNGPRYDNVIVGKYYYPEPTASFGYAQSYGDTMPTVCSYSPQATLTPTPVLTVSQQLQTSRQLQPRSQPSARLTKNAA